MTKSHLKRLIVPNSWKLNRKFTPFIIRPKPGAHSINLSLPLRKVLRDIGKARTKREITYILTYHTVNLDFKKRKDSAIPMGLFDILNFPETNDSYTLILNQLGKLKIKELKDSKLNSKLVKIAGKKKIKGGKFQILTICGRTILLDESKVKDYSVGDSLRIELPSQKVLNHIKFDKGSKIYILSGAHVGKIANIKEITDRAIVCELDKKSFETKKEFIFVIDDDAEKIITN